MDSHPPTRFERVTSPLQIIVAAKLWSLSNSETLNNTSQHETLVKYLMASEAGSNPSPVDFIKPFKDAGVTTIVWKTPRIPDSHSEEFTKRLEAKGFKVQTLIIPEPPQGYPVPPVYPELALTILNPSAADTILKTASDLLQEVYHERKNVTVKVDVVLDRRFISGEANGVPLEVGETIRIIPKIEKLSPSNLIIMVADHKQPEPPPAKFCPKCGAANPVQSAYCYKCGEKH